VRYLVIARVKPGRRLALDKAIDNRTLGAGSIAGGEYLHNMSQARALADGTVKWVEVLGVLRLRLHGEARSAARDAGRAVQEVGATHASPCVRL
jgi:hypothetical protein